MYHTAACDEERLRKQNKETMALGGPEVERLELHILMNHQSHCLCSWIAVGEVPRSWRTEILRFFLGVFFVRGAL